jgi:hypothetical protein
MLLKRAPADPPPAVRSASGVSICAMDQQLIERLSRGEDWGLYGQSEGREGALSFTPATIRWTRAVVEEQDGFDVWVDDEVVDLGSDLGYALRTVASFHYRGIVAPGLSGEDLCRILSKDFGLALENGEGLLLNGG